MLVAVIQKYIGFPPEVSIPMLIAASVFGSILLVAAAAQVWDDHRRRDVSLKKNSLLGVPPKEVFEQDLDCPEQGSKECELRGCAIIGFCQRRRK